MKNRLNLSLCFFTAVTLVLGPFLDFASAGTLGGLLRVSTGIHAMLATDCTLYAAANGNDSNSGTSPLSPLTLQGAANATSPGSVVCLLGGRYSLACTFYVPNSGTSSAWITYKSYGDGDALIVWTGGYSCGDFPMIKMDSTRSGAVPTNYLQFIGLVLDGQGTALDGFSCTANHDLRFHNNVISNTGGAGIQTINCNYVVSDHNVINHNGYILTGAPSGYSFTSGISYKDTPCNDTYTGAHLVASNNIIVGEVDQSPADTDGNGVIIDTNQTCVAPFVPPGAIVVNNLIYGNGGRCIEATQAANTWVVNNTCYVNDLDTNQVGIGSITANTATNGFVVNNISVVWKSGTQSTGGNPPYDQENTNSNVQYYNNLFFGNSACCNFSTSSNWNNPSALNSPVNPQFLGAVPYFDPIAAGQFQAARPPSALTPVNNSSPRCTGWVPTCDISSAFALSSASPAYNQGIDPTTLTTDSNMKCDLDTWVYSDINGKGRDLSNWDLGAVTH